MSKARGLPKGINARRQGPVGATLYAAFHIPLGWKSQNVSLPFSGHEASGTSVLSEKSMG